MKLVPEGEACQVSYSSKKGVEQNIHHNVILFNLIFTAGLLTRIQHMKA